MLRSPPHHHLSVALVFVSLLNALLFPIGVQGRMLRTSETPTGSVEELFSNVRALDSEFLALQRSLSLIKNNEEKIVTSSLLSTHLSRTFSSPLEEYAALRALQLNLEEAVTILRTRLAAFGKKAIHIDLIEQELAIIENGAIVAKYPVSSGAAETPTPPGEFQIHRKQTLRISNLDVPYRMPYYMAFTENQSHGLHALPYLGESAQSSDYWQEARSHIGIPVSHGCIRLLPEDAERVFEWVDVGTKVIINA